MSQRLECPKCKKASFVLADDREIFWCMSCNYKAPVTKVKFHQTELTK